MSIEQHHDNVFGHAAIVVVDILARAGEGKALGHQVRVLGEQHDLVAVGEPQFAFALHAPESRCGDDPIPAF